MTDPTTVTESVSSVSVEPGNVKPQLPLERLRALYADEYEKKKREIDKLSAEITARNDRTRYLHEIISELESCIDVTKPSVDLTDRQDLLDKLQIAEKELGVKLPPSKTKLDHAEQQLIIGNLTRKIEDWDKQNRTDMQTVDRYTKHLHTILMLLKACSKTYHSAILSHSKAIRGG